MEIPLIWLYLYHCKPSIEKDTVPLMPVFDVFIPLKPYIFHNMGYTKEMANNLYYTIVSIIIEQGNIFNLSAFTLR